MGVFLYPFLNVQWKTFDNKITQPLSWMLLHILSSYVLEGYLASAQLSSRVPYFGHIECSIACFYSELDAAKASL